MARESPRQIYDAVDKVFSFKDVLKIGMSELLSTSAYDFQATKSLIRAANDRRAAFETTQSEGEQLLQPLFF